MVNIKVGSLFDGIGGTLLASTYSGAEPVWASEIEKHPISITKRHFPGVSHLGDISLIKGNELEAVDIVVGGSPCQNLSLAGDRSGLEGEESVLFLEQIRVMRELLETESPPRYMVWENVPGAFSSRKGEDFRVVLEEIARLSDSEISIPRPKKWQPSGSILGDGWSISWRTFDAQYWGVPQRRRRIYLVADFRGESAPEILFEREGLPWDSVEGGETWQRVTTDTEGCTGEAGESCVNDQAVDLVAFACNQRGEVRDMKDKSGALQAQPGMNQQTFVLESSVSKVYGLASRQQSMTVTEECANPLLSTDYKEPQAVCYSISSYYSNAMMSSNPKSGYPRVETSNTLDTTGGRPDAQQGGTIIAQELCEHNPTDSRVKGPLDIAPTVLARYGTGGNQTPLVHTFRMLGFGDYATDGTVSTMKQRDHKDATDLVVNPVENETETHGQKYIVRRLTPLECERLQGYPDGWTALDHEGKPVSDTQRYKALGNSFAIPNIYFVISGCVDQLKKST